MASLRSTTKWNMEERMSKYRNAGLLVVVVTLLAALLAACGPAGEPTATPPAGGGDKSPGPAQVDSVDVLILESFPVQIHVVAKGNLPDSCTTIDQITEEQDGDTFRVTITTARPGEESCAQVLTPFEEVIALDVYGLPAGTYTVDVNGVTGSFTLDIDNVPQGG
jgi:inhibitor of cysteine peptidase